MLRVLILAVLCAGLYAQKKPVEKPPEQGQLDFVVTGAKGEFVPDLTAADIVVSQEGKPVKLTRFVAAQPKSPRTLVVVVDDLGLSLEGLQLVQRALRRFAAEQVQPGDRISIIRTGVHSGSIQSLTSDRGQLVAAIEGLAYNHRRDSGMDGQNAFLSGTLLQLRFSMSALRRNASGNGVVLLSERFESPPGTNSEGLSSVEQACSRIADLAHQSMAAFYAVPVHPIAGGMPSTPRVDIGLRAVVRDTGGLWIDAEDLAGALARALADQSQRYLAEFEAVTSMFDYTIGSERRKRLPAISASSSRPGLQIRARNTTYSVSENDPTFDFLTNEIDDEAAASSPVDGGAIAVRSTPLFSYSPTEGGHVDVTLHIEGKNLRFVRGANGQYRSALGIASLAFDSIGYTVGEVNRYITYSLPEEAYQSVMTQGLLYSERIPLRRPGAFQIRTSVKDEASGRVGSAGEYMEIPDIESGRLAVSGLSIRTAADTASEPMIEGRVRAALRVFRPGTKVSYSLQVYNLTSETAKPARAELSIRLFRAGVQVFAGQPTVVSLDHSPTKAHIISGTVGLNADMSPGRYVLQVITSDQRSEKPRAASQWIDLEVRP